MASVTDPVCGMTVDPAKARGTFAYNGTEYFFCSAGCRDKFAADPAGWLRSGPKGMPIAAQPLTLRRPPKPPADPITPHPPASLGGTRSHPSSQFTCPMHPEVLQASPGACPFCGMALEPAAPSADEAGNPELTDMFRRFWIAA